MPGEGLLIVVPARGGSKGLPRKNVLPLGDLPLIGWTAEAVRRSGLSDAVCVLSTDDAEIARIGRSVGLDVPFMRPPEHATDEASAEAVALHALDFMSSQGKRSFDAVMWLQPTSPFRPPRAIADALALWSETRVASVVAVKPIHRTLRTLFRMENGRLLPIDASLEGPNRRQAAEPLLTPNGALYLATVGALRDQRSFFAQPSTGLLMDAVASIDIDDRVDFEMAEAIAVSGKSWRGRLSGRSAAPPV